MKFQDLTFWTGGEVVRNNKVTVIWGILTLISLLVLLVLFSLGIVSL